MEAKFKWTDVGDNDFIYKKKILGRDVLLSYPNFSERFIINTDASKTHLRVVISQHRDPIAFYLCKLNLDQISYMTT